jgi:hypothetical protein
MLLINSVRSTRFREFEHNARDIARIRVKIQMKIQNKKIVIN